MLGSYLDDVIELGTSLNNHTLNLRAIFTRFTQHNLKMPRKCCMFRHEIQFLGRIVSEKGVSVTPDSIQCVAVASTKKPKRCRDFLGIHEISQRTYQELCGPGVNIV
jgi:hypothetical protein